MKTGHKVIAASAGLGLLFWGIDAVLDYLLFYEGSLLGLLITDVPTRGIYIRCVVLAGSVTFGVLVSTVMAERQRVQDALRKERNTSQQYLDIAGVIVVAIDGNGKVTLINRKGCEVLGYEEEEIIGNNWRDDFAPEWPKEHLAPLSKQPLIGEIEATKDHETPILTRSGEERLIAWHSIVIKDEDGNTTGHFSSGEDITERRKAEEELEDVFRLSPDMVAVCTIEGRFLRVNPAWEKVLGYTQEELLDLGWSELVHPEDAEVTTKVVEEQLKGSRVANFVNRYRCKDGSYKMLEWQATFAKEGIVHATARDITERERGEEALRESEERFRGYVETSQDLIWESDAEGIITYLNPAWERVTGYRSSELLGKSFFDFIAEEEVERERAEFAKHPEGLVNDYPTTYISKTGSEILLIFNTIPLYDAGKNIIGTLGSAYDVTERVRAEKALRDSEVRYRSLFDNSPVSLWEEDFSNVKAFLDELRLSGVSDLRAYLEARPDQVVHCIQLVDIVDVNTATINLFEAEDKVQILDSLDKLFVDQSLETLREEFCAFHEGKDTFECENLGRSLTGNLIDCAVRIAIAPGYEDSWSKVLVSVTDITERKQAEKALRESNQRLQETLAALRDTQEQMMHQERLAAVGQLSAGIAHDFNNILASIVLYTQMSLGTNDLSPTIRQRLEVIAREADRAAELVQQMLDFGRQAVLRREVLNLQPLLEETVALLERTLPENVRLDLVLEPGETIIDADPARVQQAIVNLALNARDAMPDGGELRVALSRVEDGEIDCVDCGRVVGGDWVQVTVRDTGRGIAPEVLPHIFEPFFTTRAPLGHGLGLAQVFGIVAQHGGHIAVETVVGLGTTFRLYWPALSMARAEAQVQVQSDAAPGKGQTVLVVEDNAAMRTALVAVMDMLGYQVLEAANGREALVVWEEHKSDISLVLSDWVMPLMGGLALVRELEKRDVAVKVLMLTGHPLDNETKRAVPTSVVGWLLKPVDLDQLTEAVAQALAKAGA